MLNQIQPAQMSNKLCAKRSLMSSKMKQIGYKMQNVKLLK